MMGYLCLGVIYIDKIMRYLCIGVRYETYLQ